MKKCMLIMCVLLSLFVGCQRNSDKEENQVLYVLSDYHFRTVSRSNGDRTLFDGEFKIQWNTTGCVIRYNNLEKEESVQLSVGEERIIETFAIPINEKYDFYLTYKDGKLPDRWIKMFSENERKEQLKEQFGSFEKYAESRDSKTELAMIQNAFKKINLNQDAKKWYEVFLYETWYHGDVLIRIKEAKAQKQPDNGVDLILTDAEGNEMVFHGYINDYIGAVAYKGELYMIDG